MSTTPSPPSSRYHAIVISQQQMYRVGNQVLYRTVEGYLKAGFSVTLILPSSSDPELADVATLFPGFADRLRIVRVNVAGSRVGALIKRLLGRTKPAGEAEPASPDFADPRTTLPFHPEGRVLTFFTLLGFTLSATAAAIREWRRQPADVMVGFELLGTPTALMVARYFGGAPTVGHYQGTFLGEALGKGPLALARFPADYIGTALPLDLYFMLNDGTKGDQVLAQFGVGPDRVRYRVSGVRQDMHAPGGDRAAYLRSRGIDVPAAATLIVSLSKLTGWKRIERAILAMPTVVAGDPHTHLLVAHRGPLRNALEALAKRIGVADHVHFIGPMSHTDVKLLLSVCDVFVSVNDHSNLSNPLLEAMTAECAIVTLDDGSTAGVLENGVSARLVDPSRLPDSLADGILELVRDPSFRRRLAAGARAAALAQLTSWENRIALEVAEVRELVERYRRGAGTPASIAPGIEKAARVMLPLWIAGVLVAYMWQFRSLAAALRQLL